MAQDAYFTKLRPYWVIIDPRKVFLQICVSVWIAVSKVAGILVVWKLECPCKREKMAPILPQVVSIIFDLVSYSLPANLMSLGLFFRIEQWAHTPIVKTSRLGEVDNSESVDHFCFGISDLEIEPLGMFICEEVRAHSQLVFILCPNT